MREPLLTQQPNRSESSPAPALDSRFVTCALLAAVREIDGNKRRSSAFHPGDRWEAAETGTVRTRGMA